MSLFFHHLGAAVSKDLAELSMSESRVVVLGGCGPVLLIFFFKRMLIKKKKKF